MEKKIAGCVILFNPAAEIASNIQSYCRDVGILFVIDNSPVRNEAVIATISGMTPNIVYHWMGENKGIAGGLNAACRMAMAEGWGWLLTMDQDSRFLTDGLARLIAGMEETKARFAPLGILSPVHQVSADFKSGTVARYEEARFVMTSGNLLNLDAVASIGPFEEKLFIDCVDMDYCLRLRKAGFRIIRDHNIGLQHSLGDFRTGKVGSIRIGYSNHNAGRRYYITRNKIYLLKKYFRFDPRLGWLVIRSMAGDTLRILLFEHNKFGKLRAILTGLRHSLTNHYGSYSPKSAKSRTL